MKRDKKSLQKTEIEEDGETKLPIVQKLNLQNKALEKILEEMNKKEDKDKKSLNDEKENKNTKKN